MGSGCIWWGGPWLLVGGRRPLAFWLGWLLGFMVFGFLGLLVVWVFGLLVVVAWVV